MPRNIPKAYSIINNHYLEVYKDLKSLYLKKVMQLKLNNLLTTIYGSHNPIIGNKFLKQVQMHYDMSFELEVLTKKIQMLVASCVSNEQKVKWFKKWN